MQKLKDFLESIKTRPLRITKAKNGEQLQQTDRNKLKADLLETLLETLAEITPFVYRTKEGILLELENESVANGISADSEGSGAITVAIDCKFMSLDTNASLESECYQELLASNLAKAQAKAKDKADKIARDKATRAKKKTGE